MVYFSITSYCYKIIHQIAELHFLYEHNISKRKITKIAAYTEAFLSIFTTQLAENINATKKSSTDLKLVNMFGFQELLYTPRTSDIKHTMENGVPRFFCSLRIPEAPARKPLLFLDNKYNFIPIVF